MTYGITTDKNGLSKTIKTKCRKMVKSTISHQTNHWCKIEFSKLSKLQEIIERKKIIRREKYLMQFKSYEVPY